MGKWQSVSCPALKLKMVYDTDLDFDIPMSMRGLNTSGLEKGAALGCTVFR